MPLAHFITKTPAEMLVHPLDDFYSRAGMPLPPMAEVEGPSLPEPYRSLLVHQNDMTSTLEKFHETRIHLRLHGRKQEANDYFREVVLQVDGTDKPVEFGAIHIHLDLFPAAARHVILKEYLPLGRILAEHNIVYQSRPMAYLRFASDKLINEVLELQGVHFLFGRRNRLLDAQDRPLAEIIEILPPADGKPNKK